MSNSAAKGAGQRSIGVSRSGSLLVLALLALAACQTAPPDPEQGAKYEKFVASWMQKPEDRLVSSWGIPDGSHAMEAGGRIIEYTQENAGQVVCTTRFTIDSFGLVRKSWYRGSACRVPRGV